MHAEACSVCDKAVENKNEVAKRADEGNLHFQARKKCCKNVRLSLF